MTLPSIQLGQGQNTNGGVLGALTLATDESGNGIAGGPLDGFVFRRANGQEADSWSDGVEVCMAGCGCAGAHQADCEDPDPAGGWLVTPAPPEEGEEAEPAVVVPPDHERLKHQNCPPPKRIFRAFTMFYPEECNAMGGRVPLELYRLADMGLDAYLAYMIGHELATGYFTGNPSLQSEAQDISQGTLNPSAAVGSLLDGWYDAGMPGESCIYGRPSAALIAQAQLGMTAPFGVEITPGIPGASPQHATFPPFDPDAHDGSATMSHMYLGGCGFYAKSPKLRQTIRSEADAGGNPALEALLELFNKNLVMSEYRILVGFHTCCVLAQKTSPAGGVCCGS
jgi:hypothetical protein